MKTYEFDGEKYKLASAPQKEWGKSLFQKFAVYLTIKIITTIATNSSVIGIANQIESAPAKAGRA